MKNTLFIGELPSGAPEEQAKPKKGRSKRAAPPPQDDEPRGPRKQAVQADEPREPVVFTPPAFASMPLGRLDDDCECVDSSCRGTAHDIMAEGRHDFVGLGFSEPAWLVECVLCGTGQWARVVPGLLQPREEEFVFRDGRFAGQTISEALRHPRGPEYMTWAAQSHPREAVRKAVKSHMDALAVGR